MDHIMLKILHPCNVAVVNKLSIYLSIDPSPAARRKMRAGRCHPCEGGAPWRSVSPRDRQGGQSATILWTILPRSGPPGAIRSGTQHTGLATTMTRSTRAALRRSTIVTSTSTAGLAWVRSALCLATRGSSSSSSSSSRDLPTLRASTAGHVPTAALPPPTATPTAILRPGRRPLSITGLLTHRGPRD